MRKYACVLLIGLAGCRLPEDEWGVVRVVWNDFPWWSVIWRLVFWTALGTLVGLLIGIFFTILLRRWGAYRLPWPRVRFWLQLLIFTLNIIAMPFLFGAIGFFEGLYRSGEVALRHSVIGKEWLPKIAENGADAVCCIDILAEKDQLPDWAEVQRKREPVNVPKLIDRVDRIKGGVGDKITAQAKKKLFEDNPDWEGGVSETVIDWTLPPLIYYLLNRKLQSKLGDYGVPDLWSELRKEAVKDGDDLLTHAELTTFLTDRVMIPLVLYPLRKWVSGSQWTTLGIIAAWFLTPVVLMWITRAIVFWWKRRKIRRACVDRL